MKFLLVLFASLCVVGCAQTREELSRADDADCASYGAQPGSQAYFQCRMMKDQQREAGRAAGQAAMAAAILSRPPYQPQPIYPSQITVQLPQQVPYPSYVAPR